jgi:NADPH:quinone reductase-like Zn-dependent oxidoreductase
MSRSQKAVMLTRKDAGEYELGTRPIPTAPGPGQLLIKIMAAALNPIDAHIQLTASYLDKYGLPNVVGCDGAGVVEEIGEGVTGWEVGDKV